MKKSLPLRFWWLFTCEFLFRFLAPFVIPFVLLFARKATKLEVEGKLPYNFKPEIQRYTLPKWLEDFTTQDDFLVPAIYEKSVMKQYEKYGWWIASYLGLAFRNVGMSLSWSMAKPVSGYWHSLSEQEKDEKGLFDNHYTSKPFTINLLFKKWHCEGLVLKVGYVTYRDYRCKLTNSGFVAVPRVTLRVVKSVEDGN